jgi:hypothetical protein
MKVKNLTSTFKLTHRNEKIQIKFQLETSYSSLHQVNQAQVENFIV